jgi:hypothetical protein
VRREIEARPKHRRASRRENQNVWAENSRFLRDRYPRPPATQSGDGVDNVPAGIRAPVEAQRQRRDTGPQSAEAPRRQGDFLRESRRVGGILVFRKTLESELDQLRSIDVIFQSSRAPRRSRSRSPRSPLPSSLRGPPPLGLWANATSLVAQPSLNPAPADWSAQTALGNQPLMTSYSGGSFPNTKTWFQDCVSRLRQNLAEIVIAV